jgi:hypothetical protein
LGFAALAPDADDRRTPPRVRIQDTNVPWRIVYGWTPMP